MGDPRKFLKEAVPCFPGAAKESFVLEVVYCQAKAENSIVSWRFG